jgi:serine/threonine protein kinase
MAVYENPATMPLFPEGEIQSAPTSSLRTGEYVADERYRILGAIGYGHRATVYKAEDRVTDGTVAIKTLYDEQIDPLVTRELRLHALLSGQPGIWPLQETGRLDGPDGSLSYAVTPFAAGRSLYQSLEDRTNGLETYLRVMLDIVAGVKAMGRLGIIHGDIKPANILINASSGGGLNDFGTARMIGRPMNHSTMGDLDEATLQHLQAYDLSFLSGSKGFIAPEYLMEGIAEPSVDIYSFGATLDKIAVVNEGSVSRQALARSVVLELSDLAKECQQGNPDDRPSIEETEDRLLDLLPL